MKKKVYIALSLDIIHHGHINLVNEAKKHGMANHLRVPKLNITVQVDIDFE